MSRPRQIINLYLLHSLSKGFSVFFFVLLPVLYSHTIINAKELGYIGAASIVAIIIGAIGVTRRLHVLHTRRLLQIASCGFLLASLLLLYGSSQANLTVLTASFVLSGLAVGVAISGVNALSASLTQRGSRYRTMAGLGMVTDLVRIVFPLLVAGSVALGNQNLSIYLILLASVFFLYLASTVPLAVYPQKDNSLGGTAHLGRNKPFRYILSLEFLDSFSSSQLFVFLPLLFLAKGHSIQSSLVLQSFIFMGYLSGRWIIGSLAIARSGVRAVGYAELGMVLSILLLLFVNQLVILYALTFVLGIFARGTSPVIKALSFDSLTENQMKQGSAAHVVAGDSGSALGQLLFGLLIAWFGINAPFIVAAVVAGSVAGLCLVRPLALKTV